VYEPTCPKCKIRMRLVAAGWYCMKDDILLDESTLRPIGGSTLEIENSSEII